MNWRGYSEWYIGVLADIEEGVADEFGIRGVFEESSEGGTGVGESYVVDGGLEGGGIEGAEELVDCAVEFFRSAIFHFGESKLSQNS